MSRPRVIIHISDRGGVYAATSDQPIDVIIYDTSLDADRVYRLTEGLAHEVNPAEVTAILAGEMISHVGDGRMDLAITKPTKRALS